MSTGQNIAIGFAIVGVIIIALYLVVKSKPIHPINAFYRDDEKIYLKDQQNEIYSIDLLPGPQGLAGKDGQDGQQGPVGPQGVAGPQGAPGWPLPPNYLTFKDLPVVNYNGAVGTNNKRQYITPLVQVGGENASDVVSITTTPSSLTASLAQWGWISFVPNTPLPSTPGLLLFTFTTNQRFTNIDILQSNQAPLGSSYAQYPAANGQYVVEVYVKLPYLSQFSEIHLKTDIPRTYTIYSATLNVATVDPMAKARIYNAMPSSDVYGGEFAWKNTTTQQDCETQCTAHPFCRLYSWYSNNNSCILKGNVLSDPTKATGNNSNAYTGIVAI